MFNTPPISQSSVTISPRVQHGVKEPWAVFDVPLIITGEPDDLLTITVNDDMSGLLQFRVSARGSLENR